MFNHNVVDCYIFYIKNTLFSCFLMYFTQYVSMQFLLFFLNCSSSSFFFFDKRPLKQDQGRRIKSEASRETFLQIHHIGSRVESFLYIFLFQFKMTKMKHALFHTGNHACFILVILNCISLYSHVYQALSNSICYNFP